MTWGISGGEQIRYLHVSKQRGGLRGRFAGGPAGRTVSNNRLCPLSDYATRPDDNEMSTDKGPPMETRREFIRLAFASLGALLIGGDGRASAQTEPLLIVQLEALCRRLAPLGWQKMLLAVTSGALDITAPDLARELAKPVAIDRTYPGFGDFALAGNRGIEPGQPDESLL